MTPSSIATRPKVRKNSHTAMASSSTCDIWVTSRTSSRLTRCLRASGSARRSPRSSSHRSSSGVPATARRTASGSTSSLTAATSSGSRATRNPTARAPKNATASQSTGGRQRRRDLPHLGVDEQEGREQQEHRQRPGDQPEQRGELPEGAQQRPARDRAGVEHLGRADHEQHGDVGQQHGQHQLGVLPQHRHGGRGGQREDQPPRPAPTRRGRSSARCRRARLATAHTTTSPTTPRPA